MSWTLVLTQTRGGGRSGQQYGSGSGNGSSRCFRRAAFAKTSSAFWPGLVQNADQERSDSWLVRETSGGLRIMAGRLLACELRRRTLRLSVVQPDEDACKAIGADPREADEFKLVPGALLLDFPVERARLASDKLMDAVDRFIDGAMARVVSAVAGWTTMTQRSSNTSALRSDVNCRSRSRQKMRKAEIPTKKRAKTLRFRASLGFAGARRFSNLVSAPSLRFWTILNVR